MTHLIMRGSLRSLGPSAATSQLPLLPWQAISVEICHEGIRIKLLHIEHTGPSPDAGEHHLGADHRGDTGRVGNRLRLDLFKAATMVTDIVEHQFPRLTLVESLEDTADAGFSLGGFAETARIGQECLYLDRLLVITKFLGATAIPVLVIIVQPELRRALVRLGQTRIFGMFLKGETEGMVDEVVKAALRMSRRKIGALIAIEREVGLKNYIERGTAIDAVITNELLSTIFFPGSDLHDGAVIVQKERVAAAGCLFPLSDNPNLGNVLGTRHRAAVGITEETDAIVVVISEETGTVSFAHGGRLQRSLDVQQLRGLLRKYYAQLEEAEAYEAVVEPETAEAGGRHQ